MEIRRRREMTINPCKGCGNHPYIQELHNGKFWITCTLYYCDNPEVHEGENLEDAISKWNLANLRKTCDNCKDYNEECENGRSGWICGHWREDENNQLSFF